MPFLWMGIAGLTGMFLGSQLDDTVENVVAPKAQINLQGLIVLGAVGYGAYWFLSKKRGKK